jgi:hypothetical protein
MARCTAARPSSESNASSGVRDQSASRKLRSPSRCVVLERRQVLLEGHLDFRSLAAPLVQRGVHGDPINPGAQGRSPLELRDLSGDSQKDVLDDLFRVGQVLRDAMSEPVDARRVGFHEGFEPGGITGTQEPDHARGARDRSPRAGCCPARWRTQCGCRSRRRGGSVPPHGEARSQRELLTVEAIDVHPVEAQRGRHEPSPVGAEADLIGIADPGIRRTTSPVRGSRTTRSLDRRVLLSLVIVTCALAPATGCGRARG